MRTLSSRQETRVRRSGMKQLRPVGDSRGFRIGCASPKLHPRPETRRSRSLDDDRGLRSPPEQDLNCGTRGRARASTECMGTRSPNAATQGGLPSPIPSKAFAMPAHNGVGQDDDQDTPPSWPQAAKRYPEDTIGRPHPWSRPFGREDREARNDRSHPKIDAILWSIGEEWMQGGAPSTRLRSQQTRYDRPTGSPVVSGRTQVWRGTPPAAWL